METLFIILITLLSLITLVAAFIFIRGLFPQRVSKVREAIENQWNRAFWIGLVNTIFISIIAFGLGSIAENAALLFIPTFAIYGAFLIGLLYGSFIWMFAFDEPVLSIGFLIHSIPAFIVLSSAVVGYFKKIVGVFTFALFGIFTVLFFNTYQ